MSAISFNATNFLSWPPASIRAVLNAFQPSATGLPMVPVRITPEGFGQLPLTSPINEQYLATEHLLVDSWETWKSLRGGRFVHPEDPTITASGIHGENRISFSVNSGTSAARRFPGTNIFLGVDPVFRDRLSINRAPPYRDDRGIHAIQQDIGTPLNPTLPLRDRRFILITLRGIAEAAGIQGTGNSILDPVISFLEGAILAQYPMLEKVQWKPSRYHQGEMVFSLDHEVPEDHPGTELPGSRQPEGGRSTYLIGGETEKCRVTVKFDQRKVLIWIAPYVWTPQGLQLSAPFKSLWEYVEGEISRPTTLSPN